MPRYIAFLRAINVGGHTVKMDVLRGLFESMKLAKVETFIASGNVIFETRASDPRTLEQRIERQLERELGYEVATFLRTPAELTAIVRHEPFGDAAAAAETHALMVLFLKEAPTDDARQRIVAVRTPTDEFHVHGRELYWLRRAKFNESPITGATFEKALRMPGTMRNITTVRKLAEKYAAD